MCWACDNPGASHRDYLDHVEGVIAEQGWAVQAVEADRIHPPLAYTVGLTSFGQPELLVTGMPLGRALDLLNSVAGHVVHDTAPVHGERIPLRGGPEIEIVELREPAVHLPAAAELYGPEVRGIQLVHADDRGQWPWDSGYRCGRGGQPVLGPRAP
jgi:hypothetical protein